MPMAVDARPKRVEENATYCELFERPVDIYGTCNSCRFCNRMGKLPELLGNKKVPYDPGLFLCHYNHEQERALGRDVEDSKRDAIYPTLPQPQPLNKKYEKEVGVLTLVW